MDCGVVPRRHATGWGLCHVTPREAMQLQPLDAGQPGRDRDQIRAEIRYCRPGRSPDLNFMKEKDKMRTVVIAGVARTPIGGFQWVLSGLQAPVLGGVTIRAAWNRVAFIRAGLRTVGERLTCCVLPAGQGQAPACQAGFAAGLDDTVPARTLNKM